ncbi:MAG: hypothetical protein A2092_07530 [Rhodobacteraceae bacterium GWE1_64_9]|nr:MAG: hypothetical protein A2092_07530 [Rhodobacteraceae bacterium GWE1_64_9]OHC47166.1 MAG: hypothetical protein A2X69_09345 [Rhodobacteraceae bacterium GWF1_65_7]HBD90376.1 DUF421 domain-containing protein [Gemmobacter sp.]
MTDPILPFDLGRLLLGDAPPLFLAEILLRTLVIYSFALLMLRLIGGRSVAQMSIVEFLLVIALGSAVGDGMFYPDVPLLHCLAVVAIIVGLSKLLDDLTLRFRRAKRLLDGRPVQVISDGRILTDGLRQRDMGPTELAAFLRLHGIRNLGELRAVYLEPMGQLSVFRADPPRPGLRIEPPCELQPLPPADGDSACCAFCGALAPAPLAARCPHCARTDWVAPEPP